MASVGRRVAWIGVALGATYLIFIGGGWWGIYSPYLRLLTMLIAGVGLVAWLTVAVRDPAWRPRTVMWPAIVASLGSLAISTAFSREPRVSLEYLAYAVVLAALYLLLVRLLANPFFRERLVTLCVMLFFAIAGLYIVSVIGGWIEWWQLAGLGIPPLRPGFDGLTYGNPSAALTMVVLLAVPVLGAHGGSGRQGAYVAALVGVLIATVAVMSGSRAGWFALGLTVVAALITVAAVPALRRQALDAIRSTLGRQPVVIWLPIVILLLEFVLITPALLQRVFGGGESLRLTYAVASIRMFIQSPLVGTGPGTWVIQHPGAIQTGEAEDYVPHAHNVEVQTLAELGIVGAVAGIVLLATVLRLLRRSAGSDDPVLRRWSWVGAAGLGYFFLHQLLDFYANMPAFLFAAAIPIAYLDARAAGNAEPGERARARLQPPVRRVAGGIGAGLVAACLIALTVQEIPAMRNDAAVVFADRHDWPAAAQTSREAAAMDPGIASYQFTAGLAASATGDHRAAANYFEAVVAQSDLPEAWLNLAAEQVDLGDVAAARASIARAMRIAAPRPAIAIAAGDLDLRLGDRSAALDAFSEAVVAIPSLAGDPWWHSQSTRAALYDEVLANAITGSEDHAWEVQLMAARPVDTSSPLAQLVAGAWSGDPQGVQALLASSAGHPLDLGLLIWCSRVLRHIGDASGAAAFAERVRLISLGAVPGTMEYRVTQAGAAGIAPASSLWATYTYRRAAPWDVLVGSLVHLHLE
jgi:O-antigen ligase